MLPTMAESSLRERKRDPTRQALVDAATELFERHGYERRRSPTSPPRPRSAPARSSATSPARRSCSSPRATPGSQAAVEAIAARGPDDRPADVLVRALRTVGDDSDDMASRLAGAAAAADPDRAGRPRRGRCRSSSTRSARSPATSPAAFPDGLDEVSAAALVGAFVGAVTGALQVLLEDPEQLGDPAEVQAAVHRATDVALTPWLRASALAAEPRPPHGTA